MTEQSANGPLAVLKPLFIEYWRYAATITLGTERPSVDELYGVEHVFREILDLSDSGFKPELTPQGYIIKLTTNGGCTDSGFDYRAQQKLNGLVEPKYRARATAVANVKRVQGHHKGTVVTITVDKGKLRHYTLDQVTAIPGVQRAAHDADGTLMFSPNKASEVRAITAAVADALGLYCPPVIIVDDDPKLALLPAFDLPEESTD